MGLRCIQGDETIHVPTESNHGSEQKSINNSEDGPGVDGGCVAVSVAPLGEREPEQRFQKESLWHTVETRIDNIFCSKRVGRRCDRDMTRAKGNHPLSFSDRHDLMTSWNKRCKRCSLHACMSSMRGRRVLCDVGQWGMAGQIR